MTMTLFRRIRPISLALVACVVGSACGAAQNGNVSGTVGPTPAPVSNLLTIDVAEINGPYSFYPSPATVQSEQIVVWRNSDTVTHHVVFDDGSVDTSTLAPGTLSQPLTIRPGTGAITVRSIQRWSGALPSRPRLHKRAAESEDRCLICAALRSTFDQARVVDAGRIATAAITKTPFRKLHA